MALKFGTSGVRGLVTEMTDRECYLYTLAFAQYAASQRAVDRVAVAGDLRSSTARILRAAVAALRAQDIEVLNCGRVPTPTVAAYARKRSIPCLMVTGSHIPDDRNGIKFYLPAGETLKQDEQEISARHQALVQDAAVDHLFAADGSFHEPVDDLPEVDPAACNEYRQRYLDFFPDNMLQGMRLVYYEHSAVIRDEFPPLLEQLGADVVRIQRADGFVAVDTEAVSNPDELAAWVKEHQAHALLSTDGDSDRPLLVDEQGGVFRGDVLGIVVSDYLQADVVATPVSCNTAVDKCGKFDRVVRTRIGSPYVIAAMQQATDADVVVGYEANGGYLTQTPIANPDTGAVLPALPTRDAVLPLLAALALARKQGVPVSRLTADLPPRYTCSGLLREFPNALGKEVAAELAYDKALAEEHLGDAFGKVQDVDATDGARITFDDDTIVHFRPSGNAPEFRCYTESDSPEAARQANDEALRILAESIRPAFEQ